MRENGSRAHEPTDPKSVLAEEQSAFTSELVTGADSPSREFLHALAYASDVLVLPARFAEELVGVGGGLGEGGEIGRFLVRRRLGAGGFGVVYEAFDPARGSACALKVLTRRGGDALLRFKHEFRSLAELAHPNIVQLYELHAEGERWFFTMELVLGQDALAHVRAELGSGAAPFDEARLRDVLMQLAEGLSFLHGAGKLHRDVKPSNIMVDRGGRLKLLDFGLILDFEATPRELHVAGTPRYMAPEQAAALAVGPAADWYSVGVLLHEALTGAPPPEGEEQATRLNAITPEIPADLGRLCLDLLARDPERRPSGAEVRARLLSASRAPLALSGAAFALGGRGRRGASTFVGREVELQRLDEALAAVAVASRAGGAATVAALVHGPSGAGKSALVQRFLEVKAREVQSFLALSGRCFEQEAVPYKALDSLVDALCKYLLTAPRDEVEAVTPDELGTLSRVFPVLRELPAVKAARPCRAETDALALRRRALTALRALFARLAERRPLALFIDDLQWSDLDSVALLLEMLEPPGAPRLLLIASYRSDEASSSPALRALLDGLRTERGRAVEVRDVPVGELDPEGAEALASALLGASVDGAARGARELREEALAIAAEARGNAFFITELARWAAQTGGEDGERREGAREEAPLAPRPRISDLGALIEARVTRLPEPARRLLEIVVVAGQPLPRPWAARACERQRGEREELGAEEPLALALLRAGQLLRVRQAHGQEELLPYHDRIREVVAASLPKDVWKSHHRRLALALEATGQADPERLVLHYREAGHPGEAARHARRAADLSLEALAFDRAARLYREALALGTFTIEETASLFSRLADSLTFARRPEEAARAHLEAAARSAPAEARRHQRRAMERLLTGGYVEEGLRVLELGLRDLQVKRPSSGPAGLASLLGLRCQILARGLESSERSLVEMPERARVVMEAYRSAAHGLALVDPVGSAALHARHLLLALESGDPLNLSMALGNEAFQRTVFLGARGREATDALVTRSIALAERAGSPYARDGHDLAAGLIAALRGDVRRAALLLRKSLSALSHHSGENWMPIEVGRTRLLMSLWALGDLDELSATLSEQLAKARDQGNVYSEIMLRLTSGVLAELAGDRPEGAREMRRIARERWPREGYALQDFWMLLARVAIELYTEQPRSALEATLRFFPRMLRSGLLAAPFFQAEMAQWRGLAAVAAASVGERGSSLLLRLAERDARALERNESVAWAAPFSGVLRAAVAALSGRRQQAISRLAEAEEGLNACGCHLWAWSARRARGELSQGEGGRALIAQADAWLKARGVRSPARLAAMLTGVRGAGGARMDDAPA